MQIDIDYCVCLHDTFQVIIVPTKITNSGHQAVALVLTCHAC